MSYPDRRSRGFSRDNQDDGGPRFRQPRYDQGFPDETALPSQATVKWFNHDKGFGFVTLDDGSECFLHASALTRAGLSVNEGDGVRVRVGQGPRGRQVSEVLEVQPGAGQQRRPAPSGGFGGPRPPRMGGGGRPGAAPSGPTVETHGTVKWWNATKGFGFITPTDGSKDIFVHVSTLNRCGIQQLTEGLPVSIRVSQGPKGPEAVNVSLD
jgi:CspA family cold shock protein